MKFHVDVNMSVLWKIIREQSMILSKHLRMLTLALLEYVSLH